MTRKNRRGSYAALFGVASSLFLGFAGLAVDTSLIRLAEAEGQSVADAASQAALMRLRSTGSRREATTVVQELLARNRVAGKPPTLAKIQFGTFEEQRFVVKNRGGNAVKVSIDTEVDLVFAGLWGRPTVELDLHATSSAVGRHIIVVLDITNSWKQADFANARAGALEVFDQVVATSGPDDKIGLVVFTGRFGVEQTPLMSVDEAVRTGVRDTWNEVRTVSKAGRPANNTKGCRVHKGSNTDNFSNPSGGCFPNMFREYQDESGTDHAIGYQMALQMFTEQIDPGAYRAAIFLTDGAPYGTGPHLTRSQHGYEEDRWRFIKGPKRGPNRVIRATQELAAVAWEDHEVHTWAVSFVAWAPWLEFVAQGDGSFLRAADSRDLISIMADIAESLPLALVE